MTTPELRFLAHLISAYTRSAPYQRRPIERMIDDLTDMIRNGRTFADAVRQADQ